MDYLTRASAMNRPKVRAVPLVLRVIKLGAKPLPTVAFDPEAFQPAMMGRGRYG